MSWRLHIFLIPLSILVANAVSLILQLLAPHVLPPSEYPRFALMWALGHFLSILFFDWLRIATLRYSQSEDTTLSEPRRLALRNLYLAVATSLGLVTVVIFALGTLYPALLGIATALSYALAKGLFDGNQADLRARFDNRSYATLWMSSSAASLASFLLFSYIFSNGYLALVALALPLFLLLLVRRSQAGWSWKTVHRTEMQFVARNGLYFSAAVILSSVFPVLLRFTTAEAVGISEAGGVLLALDITQKVFLTIGTAANLVLLQPSIRSADKAGSTSRPRAAASQLSMMLAIILPSIVGFYSIQPLLAPLLVPTYYIEQYLSSIGLACLISGLIAVKNYAIDTIFVIIDRPRTSSIGSLIALASGAASIALLGSTYSFNQGTIMAGAAVGIAAGTASSIAILKAGSGIAWPYKDLCSIAISCISIPLVVAPTLKMKPELGLAVSIVVAPIAYGGLLFALDAVRIRHLPTTILNRLRG